MRICQVAPYFHPHVGGVESHVYSLCKELSRRGHEVTVYTTLSNPSLPLYEIIDGFDVHRVPPLFTVLRTPIIPELKKELVTWDGDVVHAHSPPPLSSYYAAKACAVTKKSFVLTHHCDLEIPSPLGPVIVGLYEHTLGRYTLSRADRVIVTSHSYAATSKVVWGRGACPIPNPVAIDRFAPSVSGRKIRRRYRPPLILFVGRLVYQKGLEYLIRSAEHVPDATYLIVGDGPMRKELEAIARHIAPGRIVFAGRVPDKELPRYYGACDIFILPSISRLEAFGIVVLEAMASGKPVIATDVPGVRDVVIDNVDGLIAEPLNAKDLAEHINRLLADPTLRKRMGQAGRAKVLASYTPKIVAQRVEGVYEEAIAQR